MEFSVHDYCLYMDNTTSQCSRTEEWSQPRMGRDLKWKLKGFLQSAKWMVITMLAPEVIMGMALYDLLWAKQYHQKLLEFASQDRVPWTLTHTYYVNMGGFAIQSGVQEDVRAIPYIPSEKVNTSKGPEKADVIDNDKEVPESHPTVVSENGGSDPYHNPYHLTALEICELRDEGTLPKLPYISEEELGDKSKSNSFIKAIAIFQIVWATYRLSFEQFERSRFLSSSLQLYFRCLRSYHIE